MYRTHARDSVICSLYVDIYERQMKIDCLKASRAKWEMSISTNIVISYHSYKY